MNVAVDACVIIDLAQASSMEAFGEVPDKSFLVTDSVEFEIKHPDQLKMLMTEIGRGAIARARLEDMSGLELYAHLRLKHGEGECSCLAFARTKGGCIATSETKRKFMNVAGPLIGKARILRTADILKGRRRIAAE